ncbi:MAG: DUF420 domain-containing protein [Deltaproteobacteria bacterium]|nr:DUF420 domain-containing protein [Deltaproteobacteria bacterium]
MATETSPAPASDRNFFVFNAVASAGALALLAYLLLVRKGTAGAGVDLRFLPAVNAGLNSLSALLLLGGWMAVKNKRQDLHRYFMVSAFLSSALFLVGYLAYHAVHGDTRYAGDFRGLYLTVLASHVLLSLPVVPLALSAFYFAWKKRFDTHKKVTRVLWPIWMYVSVTGVAVYFLLRGSAPAVH